MKRPNIVWIMSEDFPPLTGAYGDPLADTPNLDTIARDGILFENAYCASPVCAPSRFSVLTGVYPWSCGPGQNMEATAHVPDALAPFPFYLREAGYYCTNNAKTHYNSDIDPDRVWDESSPRAHWRNRPEGAPFFAAIMPQQTHESALFREEVGPVSPEDVRVPAYLPDVPDVRADIARYYSAIAKLDAQVGMILDELRDDGVIDDTIIVWTSDHGGVMARSKRFCYDEGLRIPLVFRFPPRWHHLSPWSPGARVVDPVGQIDVTPSILSLAGADIPDHFQGTALVGHARREASGVAFGGRDRMDERFDMMRTVRDEHYRYIRNYDPDLPWGQHYAFAWLAANWRAWERGHLREELNEVQDAFWHPKPAEELYAPGVDPDEVINLAADPEHRHELARLRALLDEHQRSVRDNGFIPEGSPLEGWESTRNEDDYPLERAMSLAAMSTERDPGRLDVLVSALRDENEAIRYQAARGLRMLGSDAVPALDELRAALDDASPAVRITAAEAIGSAGDPAEALPALTAALDTEGAWIDQLRALNALTLLASRASGQALSTPSVTDALAPLSDSDNQYVRAAARYLSHLLAGTYMPDTEGIFDWGRFLAKIGVAVPPPRA